MKKKHNIQDVGSQIRCISVESISFEQYKARGIQHINFSTLSFGERGHPDDHRANVMTSYLVFTPGIK